MLLFYLFLLLVRDLTPFRAVSVCIIPNFPFVTLFQAFLYPLLSCHPRSPIPFTLYCIYLLERYRILDPFVYLPPYFTFLLQASGAICMHFHPLQSLPMLIPLAFPASTFPLLCLALCIYIE